MLGEEGFLRRVVPGLQMRSGRVSTGLANYSGCSNGFSHPVVSDQSP